MTRPVYSERLDDALLLATRSFRSVRRKGTEIPYLTHLLQVMVHVGEHGGDEDQLIAAVLHDYLEDVEGSSEEELAERFGERVARMVAALSDTKVRPKPPWRERKEAYLAHLRDEPAEVKLISCADKLHNASCILRDLRSIGDAIWARFSAPREATLWYYRSVVEALGQGWTHPLLDALGSTVDAIHHEADVQQS